MPTLRDVNGRICPSCRTLYAPRRGRELEQCPNDGVVLVDTKAYTEAGEDPLLGRAICGRFILLEKLGAGSMGTVYRARQEPVGRDVALKILQPDRAFDDSIKVRFEREARATSLLTSPHTVTVFDFGEAEDGSLFLAMELLQGESLGARLRRVGRLKPEEAVHIACEALSSLAEAHAKGIIHRDIKPDNLFLARVPSPDGRGWIERCKVLDFGIAKMLRPESRFDSLETQAGTVFGTPRFMSPEQAQGKPLDARSDIYSLALIVYQMLCGQPPFTDDDAVVVMAQHIKMLPAPLSEVAPGLVVPPALEAAVHRALSKDADRRPSSANEFAAVLRSSIGVSADGVTIRPVADGTGPMTAVTTLGAVKRERVALTVVAIIAALAIGGLFVSLFAGGSKNNAVPPPATASALPTVMPTQAPASSASATSSVVTPSSLPPAGDPSADPNGAAAGSGANKPNLPPKGAFSAKPLPTGAATGTSGGKYGRFD